MFCKKHKIKVKAYTIDYIVEKLKLKNISLIKIDTEGTEDKILSGAIKTLQRFKSKIIFESDVNFNNCFKILNKLNYQIYKIDELNYVALPIN